MGPYRQVGSPPKQPEMGRGQRHSLFSQRLDRAVLASYFVGGVVPVGAFAFVVHRYVLPGLQTQGVALAGWVGACVSLGLLSLAVFLAARRYDSRAATGSPASSSR